MKQTKKEEKKKKGVKLGKHQGRNRTCEEITIIKLGQCQRSSQSMVVVESPEISKLP